MECDELILGLLRCAIFKTFNVLSLWMGFSWDWPVLNGTFLILFSFQMNFDQSSKAPIRCGISESRVRGSIWFNARFFPCGRWISWRNFKSARNWCNTVGAVAPVAIGRLYFTSPFLLFSQFVLFFSSFSPAFPRKLPFFRLTIAIVCHRYSTTIPSPVRDETGFQVFNWILMCFC